MVLKKGHVCRLNDDVVAHFCFPRLGLAIPMRVQAMCWCSILRNPIAFQQGLMNLTKFMDWLSTASPE